MVFWNEMKRYACFTWGLRGFLRQTMTMEEAKVLVRKQLMERETNFLRLVEKGIFDYPDSPYLPLFKMAGCEMGDLEAMVLRRGLEDTLRALLDSGVYITFEEFKGRKPVVRNGRVLSEGVRSFDNPHLQSYYEAKTGGTTGKGSRVAVDLSHIHATTPFQMLTYDAHSLLETPMGIWRGILPDESGLHAILKCHHYGLLPQKWFSPITRRDYRPSPKNWASTHAVVVMGRLYGIPIPWPEPVPLEEARRIARWMSQAIKRYGKCHLNCHVSLALRVAIAAREEGIDLTGATFSGGGEPPTPTKVHEITRTGARYVPNYFIAETGVVGFGCARPSDIDDLHLFKGGIAIIQHPQPIPQTELSVNLFHITTLLSTTPKIMINVKIDDYGLIEKRSCGCLLEQHGFTDHIRQIRSINKLTGEGVTLVGSEMSRILEEVLPVRFGGSPLDYQLLEEEDARGFTRLNLLIHPSIPIRDESEVIRVMLEALREGSGAGDLARAIWSQAGTLRIKRSAPVWTDRGKMMPLHLGKFPGKEH